MSLSNKTPRIDGKPYPIYQKGIVDSSDFSKTQQEDKDECDINIIVAKNTRGHLAHLVNPAAPRYGDFTEIPNFQEMFEIVHNAHDAFDALPASARRELQNDPRNLFTADRDFYARHGLLKPPLEEAPAPAAVQADPAPEKSKKADKPAS